MTCEHCSPRKSTIRLSLDVTHELNDALEQLMESTGRTKSGVLRVAIALYFAALDAEAKGHRIFITDAEDKLLTRIVGLR